MRRHLENLHGRAADSAATLVAASAAFNAMEVAVPSRGIKDMHR